MNVNDQNIVTAPVSSVGTGDAVGGSRSPVPLGAAQGRCDVEAPQTTNSASVLHAKLASPSTRVSRAQAEEQCAKAIEQTMADLGKIEEAIAGAPNTKKDVKDSARSLSISIRAMMKLLLALDKVPTSSRDQVKSQQEQLQKQQQLMQQQQLEIRQQHRQTQEAIKKLQEAQTETSLLVRSETGATTAKTLPSEVRDILLDQGAKIDSLTKDLKALLQEQRQSPLNPSHLNQDQEALNPERKTKRQAQRQRMKRKQKINSDQQEALEENEPNLPAPIQEGTGSADWKTVKKKDTGKKLAKVAPDAIIIKITEDKTYADTLRSLKKGLNDAGLTDEVAMSKRTMNGDLFLQLKKKTNKTSQVRTIVGDSTGAETYLKTTTVAVEIRGLDTDATPEDLVAAISARTTSAATTENIKAIKQGYGGKLTAVVILPARVANELARGPRLRIGWASCSIRIRTPVNRCTRCLDFGHRKSACVGPDRTGICLNCWKPGHTKKDCDARARCGLCEEDGAEDKGDHFSGSGKCPTFKRFLADCGNQR